VRECALARGKRRSEKKATSKAGARTKARIRTKHASTKKIVMLQRREAKTQQLILIAFGALAVTACLATLIASRLFWRRWTDEVRQFLRGKGQRREFQPILGDLRAMMDRISTERWTDAETGAWTPQRLKDTLVGYLQGERVVVLANREPYIHEYNEDRTIRVMRPASGLVTALEPVMHACSGVWIAHGGGSADRVTADPNGRLLVPPGEESYALRRIWLTPEEEKSVPVAPCVDAQAR